MQEILGRECSIAIATSTMLLLTRATQEYFTLPGSSPLHGNQATAAKAGRAYLALTSNGDIGSFLTPKTPKKFTSQPSAGAFGMVLWMEKIVHWTSLHPSFSLDKSEGTYWRERGRKPHGKCVLVEPGGLATCSDK